MIGIYKYTNKINNHIYIGQSINIETRQKNHLYAANNEKASDYDVPFHKAIRKYGISNFDFEIIAEIMPEEYSQELLNNLEKFFIQYYDSYKNGYNATEGGDQELGNRSHPGETNGRAILTEEDINYIRECYNAHVPFREVYEEYKEKISKRGLQKVWWFETWKNIHPEYHTEENKYWHSHEAKKIKNLTSNQKAFSVEQVIQMRKDYDNGLSPKQVWLKYAPERAWTTVYNVITRKTYKDIK